MSESEDDEVNPRVAALNRLNLETAIEDAIWKAMEGGMDGESIQEIVRNAIEDAEPAS